MIFLRDLSSVEQDSEEAPEKKLRLDHLVVDRFVAKFFDEAAEDLRINRVFDVYGVLVEHNLCDDEKYAFISFNRLQCDTRHEYLGCPECARAALRARQRIESSRS